MKRSIIKLKILLKQNWIWFAALFIWFLANYIGFYFLTGGNFTEALMYTFYFGQLAHPYGYFYIIFSQCIILGLIISLVTVGLYRNYHPRQTCLTLAKSMKNHIILIGFSHLGQRIREFLIKNKKKYVIIEEEEALIKDLIEAEEPIIPQKPIKREVLENANVKDAKLVICTKNSLENLVVGANLIRDVNKTCKIICECFDDSLAPILEKDLGCTTISTSLYAADYIMAEIDKLNPQNILLIGCTYTTRCMLKQLKDKNIIYKIIEYNRTAVEDLLDEEPIIIGDAKDKDILAEAGISSVDLAIILIDTVQENLIIADQIRELNKNCPLICRFFHEELAEILEKPPFNALVISTSKHMLEKLIEMGIFKSL